MRLSDLDLHNLGGRDMRAELREHIRLKGEELRKFEEALSRRHDEQRNLDRQPDSRLRHILRSTDREAGPIRSSRYWCLLYAMHSGRVPAGPLVVDEN